MVDGFEQPERAAAAVVACTASTKFLRGFKTRQDVAAEPFTLDGHKGWRIRTDLQGEDENGSYSWLVEVVVVDLDSPEALGMFWGITQNIDADGPRALTKVISQLRLD